MFWIKGDGCIISKVSIIDNAINATHDGEVIVRITGAGSCYEGESELQLSRAKKVTDEASSGISKSLEFPWEVSASVTVASGETLSATVGNSVGGTVTYEISRTKSTSSETSSGSTATVKYFTPSVAMIVGFVKQ